MKLIVKGREPAEWKAKRETPGATYEATAELKIALLNEQGFICCYCMSRIESETMKVEHFKSRSKHIDQRMIYENMMATCLGKTCTVEHCDTSRGNGDLVIEPKNIQNNVSNLLSYLPSDCTIISPEIYRDDVDVKLNLNAKILKDNRLRVKKRVFVALDMLHKKNSSNWSAANIQKVLKFWTERDNNNKFQPYCQMMVYFLEKKLRSA